MLETSGSAGYAFDWHRLEIVHADGRRWNVPRYMERVYAALDAVRGQAFSAERIAEAIWGVGDTGGADCVRVAVFNLRRKCGARIIETARVSRGSRGRTAARGYIVR